VRRIELASEDFELLGLAVTEMWVNLRIALDFLGTEAVAEMYGTRHEILDLCNLTLSMHQIDPRLLKRELNPKSHVNNSLVTTLLLGISAVEFVCYLVFFFIKRRSTRGFKKLD
jgi:hypothetical protein